MTNSHPLEVVDRSSETQLQVGENLISRFKDQPFELFLYTTWHILNDVSLNEKGHDPSQLWDSELLFMTHLLYLTIS